MKDCSICLKVIRNNYKLECNHSYCKCCIFSWGLRNYSCPMCRELMNKKEYNEIVNYYIDKKILNNITIYSIKLSVISEKELEYIKNYLNLEEYFNIYFKSSEWTKIINKIIEDERCLEIFRKMPVEEIIQFNKKKTLKIYSFSFL